MDLILDYAHPLPEYLTTRYHDWTSSTDAENKALLRRLADEGQSPRAMVISCCDSRVHPTAFFGADQGEIFMHRNIASLVPPYDIQGGDSGTPAAIEYGVTALKVSHLIVIGHSQCGGVKGCHDMCNGNAPALEDESSFVGRWIETLRRGYDRLSADGKTVEIEALEKEAVIVSLENLMTFPFIKAAVENGSLRLHGLWNDIGDSKLEFYDAAENHFAAV